MEKQRAIQFLEILLDGVNAGSIGVFQGASGMEEYGKRFKEYCADELKGIITLLKALG